ncbi:unnamed protein product [Rotaria socialis]|uniref:Uncharacterized protein n=2 Tax=Rotaria socialis TaxID=392032 RepID=A0A818BRV7_9BILA|nr:unnamed protein product [Rotaria socialis]
MNSSNNDALLDISVLPKDIFERVDREFYDAVKSVVGDSLVKILKIQLINSAGKLLNTPDLFAFLNFDSEETDAIKLESYFKSKTGQLVIKPGIQSSSSYLIKLLKKTLKQKQESASKENNDNYQNYVTDEFLDNHPLLRSLIKWLQLNNSSGVHQPKQTKNFNNACKRTYFLGRVRLKQKQESASKENNDNYQNYVTDEFLDRRYSFRMSKSYSVEEIQHI